MLLLGRISNASNGYLQIYSTSLVPWNFHNVSLRLALDWLIQGRQTTTVENASSHFLHLEASNPGLTQVCQPIRDQFLSQPQVSNVQTSLVIFDYVRLW
jgi:hypothetical protein